MKKRSTLERQMLTYFGLIAAASLLITVEFVWAVQRAILKAGVIMDASSGVDDPATVMLAIFGDLRNQAIMMGIVQAVITLVVLVMLIRRITGPLQQIAKQARIISEGDLSRTIEVSRRDEIGLVAETINGLTSNIQEIVAIGLSTDDSLKSPIQELRARIGEDAACRDLLDRIEARLDGFRGILEDFKLLPAPPADERIRANP
jgi:methyl-accepting chemotaxis protein